MSAEMMSRINGSIDPGTGRFEPLGLISGTVREDNERDRAIAVAQLDKARASAKLEPLKAAAELANQTKANDPGARRAQKKLFLAGGGSRAEANAIYGSSKDIKRSRKTAELGLEKAEDEVTLGKKNLTKADLDIVEKQNKNSLFPLERRKAAADATAAENTNLLFPDQQRKAAADATAAENKNELFPQEKEKLGLEVEGEKLDQDLTEEELAELRRKRKAEVEHAKQARSRMAARLGDDAVEGFTDEAIIALDERLNEKEIDRQIARKEAEDALELEREAEMSKAPTAQEMRAMAQAASDHDPMGRNPGLQMGIDAMRKAADMIDQGLPIPYEFTMSMQDNLADVITGGIRSVENAEVDRVRIRSIQERIDGAMQSLVSLGTIRNMTDDSYLTIQGRAYATVQELKDHAGMSEGEGRQWLMDRAAWKSMTDQQFQLYRKFITGAQASFQELKFLEQIVPNSSDPPSVFRAKLIAVEANYRMILGQVNEWQKTGKDLPNEDEMDQIIANTMDAGLLYVKDALQAEADAALDEESGMTIAPDMSWGDIVKELSGGVAE